MNKAVQHKEPTNEVHARCEEIMNKSQKSLRLAKASLKLESEQLHSSLAQGACPRYAGRQCHTAMRARNYGTEENPENVNAFLEKRKPNYRKLRHDQTLVSP